MSEKSKRQAIVGFIEANDDNYMKAFAYINCNLQQIYYSQVEMVVTDEEELPDESIAELYNYLFDEKGN